MNNVAKPHSAVGQLDRGLLLYKRTRVDHSAELASMNYLARAYKSRVEFTKAEPLLRKCRTLREEKQPDAGPTFATKSELGESLLGQQKYGEAQPLLRACYQGMK